MKEKSHHPMFVYVWRTLLQPSGPSSLVENKRAGAATESTVDDWGWDISPHTWVVVKLRRKRW